MQWDKEPAVAGGLSCNYARWSNCAASAGGQSRQWGLRGSVHPLCLVDFGSPNLALGGPLTWVNTGGRSLPTAPQPTCHQLPTKLHSTECTLYCQAEKNHQCAQRRGVPFDSQTWLLIRWKLQLRNIWPFLFFHRLGSGVQLQVAEMGAAGGNSYSSVRPPSGRHAH